MIAIKMLVFILVHFLWTELSSAQTQAPETAELCLDLEIDIGEIVEFGYVRPGGTFNDPADFITSTAVECNSICEFVEKCESWSWDTISKACALKVGERPFYQDERFDAGVIGGVAASGVAILDSCYQESGVAYSNGRVLSKFKTKSDQECCKKCREDLSCFSWYRVKKMCTLNYNVPQRQKNHRSTGASLF